MLAVLEMMVDCSGGSIPVEIAGHHESAQTRPPDVPGEGERITAGEHADLLSGGDLEEAWPRRITEAARVVTEPDGLGPGRMEDPLDHPSAFERPFTEAPWEDGNGTGVHGLLNAVLDRPTVLEMLLAAEGEDFEPLGGRDLPPGNQEEADSVTMEPEREGLVSGIDAPTSKGGTRGAAEAAERVGLAGLAEHQTAGGWCFPCDTASGPIEIGPGVIQESGQIETVVDVDMAVDHHRRLVPGCSGGSGILRRLCTGPVGWGAEIGAVDPRLMLFAIAVRRRHSGTH